MATDPGKWRLVFFNEEGCEPDIELLAPGKKLPCHQNDIIQMFHLSPDEDAQLLFDFIKEFDRFAQGPSLHCGVVAAMRLAFDAGRHATKSPTH